jgi:glycosyltransferase involved in cell wall biosynthesis
MTIRIMTRHRISILLERNSANRAGRIAAWLLRVPFHEEVIDPDYSRSAVRAADRVIAYTPKVLRGLVSQERIVLITAGANLEIFKPGDGTPVREKYGVSGKKVIVYVGSEGSWHGALVLICAMGFIPDDYRALVVCQSSDDLAKSAALIGVSDRISFTSFVRHDEVPVYICAADVAVAPYEPSGLRGTKQFGFYFSPLKLFEYMACGRPMVASDVELVREVVAGSGCGLLVPPSDPWMLARGIIKVVGSPDRGDAMGVAGRKACISKYNWDAVGRQIATAIRECLQ